MHMADALISPTVGFAMMTATAGLAAYSIKKINNDITTQRPQPTNYKLQMRTINDKGTRGYQRSM